LAGAKGKANCSLRASPWHVPEILEQALDIALEKKDPKRKLERREE
jgi:hypothetical protein